MNESPQVFDPKMVKILLDCLYYARHRHKTAPESGIRRVLELKHIDQAIKQVTLLEKK